MKKFIVIALTLQGLRKQPFEAGEIVKEDNLPPGQAEELVKKGFLKEFELEEPTKMSDDEPAKTGDEEPSKVAKKK